MAITTCVSSYSISKQGKELVEHGTPLFPAAFYLDNLEFLSVPWHWHDEMEVAVVVQGEATVSVGSQHYPLKAGQGFFINSNELHGARGKKHTNCQFHSIVFHPKLIAGDIESIFWQEYLRPVIKSGQKSFLFDGSESWHREALEHIEHAWQASDSDRPGFEFEVRADLSRIIFLCFSHLPPEDTAVSEKTQRDTERLKLMLTYIDENSQQELSLADIAKSAMISESECLRCFKSTIGYSPIQYVKRFRVQKAAELLSSTDLRIAEISDRCGFQDPSYFTRAFREIKGIPPGAYREAASQS